MRTLDVVFLVFAVVGVLFGARCWLELWKWAKLAQRAQIAVAYKNKVKVNHPIQEWMLMVNLLGPGETGRTVYSLGGTRVAIIRGKPITVRNDLRKVIRLGFFRLTGKQVASQTGGGGPRMRSGGWSARDDKTGATRSRSE